MITYTCGFTIKAERNVTKNDIITMCNLLNGKDEYSKLCDFIPEGITEGGILFRFNEECDKKWYKSVRFSGVDYRKVVGEWGNWDWVTENVMTDWYGNNDLVFPANIKITIFLKSFHGAPLFTLEELKIWDECFTQIGFKKIGKYPTQKNLSSNPYG